MSFIECSFFFLLRCHESCISSLLKISEPWCLIAIVVSFI
uniref:Uncharacterized protein n=1 Tax=Arundo donax TaxID=35708 RepID=A0A0A9GX98_ARUDO